MALLNVDKLSVHFGDVGSEFRAVDRISYSVNQGEVVGIVGESGSGKSVSSLAIMGLIDYPGRVMAENLEFNGRDLKRISEKERRQLVGAEVAMIFQDPMTSLNPCYTVGYQIMEAIKVHQGGNKKTRIQRAIDLLTLVGIPDPASRLDVYPHQLSGGMSQRVMIAMAIACRPKLLIADEPTTALDVSVQAQILQLLRELRTELNMGLLFITHNLSIVRKLADRVAVMQHGHCVEQNSASALFAAPQHHQPRHSHKAFLKYIQHYKRSDPAIPCHQAEHHSALCQLVRHRVQQNAQLRNLVETPRDFTIEQVCEAGYPQYHSRPKKLGGRFRFEVQIHKQRDQQNAEIAEDVRDSEHLPQGRFFHVGCSFTRDCFQCTGRGCIYKLRACAIFFFMV